MEPRREQRPDDALRLLSESDVGRAHSLVESFRNELVEAGLVAGNDQRHPGRDRQRVPVLGRLGLVACKLERIRVPTRTARTAAGPTEAEVDLILHVVDAAAEAGT